MKKLMEILWKYLDEKNLTAMGKYRRACLITGALSGILGFALWLLLRNWLLSGPDWMVCFIGYPIVISLFITLAYGFGHEFQDGSKGKGEDSEKDGIQIC